MEVGCARLHVPSLCLTFLWFLQCKSNQDILFAVVCVHFSVCDAAAMALADAIIIIDLEF
jgi:hypothetical protein